MLKRVAVCSLLLSPAAIQAQTMGAGTNEQNVEAQATLVEAAQGLLIRVPVNAQGVEELDAAEARLDLDGALAGDESEADLYERILAAWELGRTVALGSYISTSPEPGLDDASLDEKAAYGHANRKHRNARNHVASNADLKRWKKNYGWVQQDGYQGRPYAYSNYRPAYRYHGGYTRFAQPVVYRGGANISTTSEEVAYGGACEPAMTTTSEEVAYGGGCEPALPQEPCQGQEQVPDQGKVPAQDQGKAPAPVEQGQGPIQDACQPAPYVGGAMYEGTTTSSSEIGGQGYCQQGDNYGGFAQEQPYADQGKAPVAEPQQGKAPLAEPQQGKAPEPMQDQAQGKVPDQQQEPMQAPCPEPVYTQPACYEETTTSFSSTSEAVGGYYNRNYNYGYTPAVNQDQMQGQGKAPEQIQGKANRSYHYYYYPRS